MQTWPYKGISMVLPSLCGDARQSLSLVSLMFAPPLLHMERRGNEFRVWGDSYNIVLLCTSVFLRDWICLNGSDCMGCNGLRGHVEGYLFLGSGPVSLLASLWLRVHDTNLMKATMSWSLALVKGLPKCLLPLSRFKCRPSFLPATC